MSLNLKKKKKMLLQSLLFIRRRLEIALSSPLDAHVQRNLPQNARAQSRPPEPTFLMVCGLTDMHCGEELWGRDWLARNETVGTK